MKSPIRKRKQGNGSAPAPMKDATSCDMPRGDASNLRSEDFRMRLRNTVTPCYSGFLTADAVGSVYRSDLPTADAPEG